MIKRVPRKLRGYLAEFHVTLRGLTPETPLDTNRSEGQGGFREELTTTEVRGKSATVGTRTGREAAMRTMRLRESPKSNP